MRRGQNEIVIDQRRATGADDEAGRMAVDVDEAADRFCHLLLDRTGRGAADVLPVKGSRT
jgi:hypothetical protein